MESLHTYYATCGRLYKVCQVPSAWYYRQWLVSPSYLLDRPVYFYLLGEIVIQQKTQNGCK